PWARGRYRGLRHRAGGAVLARLSGEWPATENALGAAARRQSSVGRVPRQLPAAVAHFAGRVGELAMLTGLLRGRADTGGTVVISAIGGTAGVGKTALVKPSSYTMARPAGFAPIPRRGS